MKKLAKDLRRGDVVIGALNAEPPRRPDLTPLERVVVAVTQNGPSVFVQLATPGGVERAVAQHPEAKIEVEARDLTPAQQHADALVDMLRAMLTVGAIANVAPDVRALLDKIDPPKPPTLEEALALLAETRDELNPLSQGHGARVGALIERARRAGVLK